MNAEKVAVVCKALGDANRLEIVQMLSDGEKCGCKILERFEITHLLFHNEKHPMLDIPDDFIGDGNEGMFVFQKEM